MFGFLEKMLYEWYDKFITVKELERCIMTLREIAEQREEKLFELAAKSYESKGRLVPIDKCSVRSEFERDESRILYSQEFRRLRHKTQVFFNAKNDHICTRMEHVLYVRSIAYTIAKALNLNTELTSAIAIGHDLGHAPFGHSGESALGESAKAVDSSCFFKHELHSLRVVDRLATRVSDGLSNGEKGLNLTFEVRDGIVSHCGEDMRYRLEPDFNKKPEDILNLTARPKVPATLEGCVVRLVDKIAYVGRDIEDAMRAQIMDKSDIPSSIASVLGNTNGEIINTLVIDMINESKDKSYIALSSEIGEALSALIDNNYKKIYSNPKVKRYEKQARNVVEGLFDDLIVSIADREHLENDNIKVHQALSRFIKDNAYGAEEKDTNIVCDFIAGMTDNYALSAFEEIYGI